jgi:DNA cross-link repair 1C protein
MRTALPIIHPYQILFAQHESLFNKTDAHRFTTMVPHLHTHLPRFLNSNADNILDICGRYLLGLYGSLGFRSQSSWWMDEILFLSGFRLGNSFMPGCLTADESSRVHSCGPEFMCASVAAENAVFITPVVTRTQDGSEVPEVGAGGGVRDLYQSHELELSDKLAIGQLERLCRVQIEDTRVLSRTKEILASAFKSKDKT